MKNLTRCIVVLGLLCVLASNCALAQPNFTAVPQSPTAGQPFQVTFDDNPCDIFIVDSPVAPSVQVTGLNVQVEVDYLDLIDCSADFFTHRLNIPGLPQGEYQFELYGRAFGSPGSGVTLQTITVVVGGAVTGPPRTIPSASVWSNLGLLAMLSMAALFVRARTNH